MKYSVKQFSTGLCLLLLAVLNGCASAKRQEFTGLTPDQAPLLLEKSKHVLEVSTKPQTQRADYNLRENLRMLAPVPRSWKIDLEWEVKRVLKGSAPGTTLLVKHLPFPSEEARNLGFTEWNAFTNPFTNGLILWIGFDGYEDFHFKNLKLLKPTEDQIQLSADTFEDRSNTAFRNRSIASVKSLTLEVEQPLYETKIHILIRDGSWNENPSCDVYYVNELGKESWLATVRLFQLAPSSNKYWGSFSEKNELSHGTTLKIVYKSNALRLPISTWITMIYH